MSEKTFLTVRELSERLDAIWPPSLSAPWDNDGLMCAPDPDAPVRRAVVSLDATLPAIRYAAESGSVLVTHHPMIFRGLSSVVSGDFLSDRVIFALRNGVAVISAHTRLDAAKGGVNDALCAAVGIVPDRDFGDDESPTLGRVGTLSGGPLDACEFARRVKRALGSPAVTVTGDGRISRVAVVGGSGGDFIVPALKAGADALLTGEAGYNSAEDGAENGAITVVEAGHYHTEAPVLPVIAEELGKLGVEVGTVFDSYPSRVY
ncbi:MAG: Nif3-like dinuclear metal center hexameric protein [Clostridia bacterium]|nr:Nif3-like dinuclear metal center hexameric protein [Clostridia bacterium]